MSSYFSSFFSRVSTAVTPSNEDGSGSPKKSVADSSAPASSGFSLLSLSPKKMLSQVIAAALQEFFIIEDAAQQIQLLDRSNRINLTNLQLQPQVVLSKDGSCFKSKGVVEHVELSWVWGGNEQTSFIRDISLLVKGVQVTVVEEDYEDDGTETSDTTADNRSVASLNPSQPAPKDSKKAEGYFERYVQQMIDHLTLKIEDLQVVLEVENSEKTVVGIQSLCLLTLGKEEDGNGDSARILSQRISVDRFAVNIIAQGQKHPLLLPFGYAASVTRKSGKRFQDGFLTGLEVQGQVFYDANETASQSTDGQWTLRLGKQQARVVSNFMEMLSKYQQPSSSTPVQEDNERLDPKEEHQKDVQPREHGGNSQSTFIVLPLPALALVFDQSEGNAVRIDLPDCTFSCRLDMSLCQVTGGGTIMINQTCPLLQLPNGAEWVLDGVAKSMVVRQSQESFARDDDDIVVTHLNVEEAPLRRLVTTVMDVAAVINETTPSLDKEELWAGMEHAVTEEWVAWQEKNETAVFSFALQGRASLRMSSLGAKGTVEWLDAFLEASSFSVQSDGTVQKLHSGKFEVGPTSLGGASLIIPAGALHSDANSMAKFRFTDFVTATIDSAQVADNLKAFFMTFASISSELQEAPLELSRNDSVNLGNIRLPFFIQIPGLRARVSSPLANFVIKTLNVSHTGNLAIEAVDAEIESGMKVSASGLQVALNERIEGSLGLLQVLEIPDVVACQDVTDVTFSFHESLLQIKLGSLALQLPEMQKPTATDSQTAVNIPFPLHLLADSIQTKVGKTGFDIITENVNLTAKPCGDILHFEHSNQLFVKLVHENGMGAVEMGVGTPGGDPTKLSVNINTMKIVEMECQSPNVSSLSFGKLDASALSLEFEPATNAIVLLGECNLFAESEQGAMKLKDCFQPLVDYFTDKESTEPGYCVKVPKAVVLMESPMQACTTLENVMYDGVNIVQVGQVHAHEKETDASSTLSGISVSMEPLSATIAMVEDILVPGAARLTDPIKDIQFWYKSGENTGVDELIIVLSAVKVALLQPQPVTETSLSPSKTPEPIELPCNIKYSIDVLSLLDTNFPNASPTVFEKLFGSVQMPAVDPFNPQQEIPKMAIMKGAFGSMQNDMLLLSNGQFHAETRDTSGEAFENVRFQAKDGTATAGFSSIDWDSMFGGKVANAPASVTRLGFCCIEPLEVGLKYKGVMVRTESRILIPKFVGHAQTTSDDVVQHFKSAILRRAPAFLAKANVLGANLGDSAASTAGMIAMAGSSVAGASGAAVAGIVAYDGVVAAIRSGKSARGVSEHEKYKFGDITRGSIRAMGSVREGGASVATSSASEYAKNNSSRLGGAAGSTAGMIAGAALLGPVGLIGGAVVGARAGARAFQTSKNSQASDTTANGGERLPAQHTGHIDLLDDSFGGGATTTSPPPAAAFASHTIQQTQQYQQQTMAHGTVDLLGDSFDDGGGVTSSPTPAAAFAPSTIPQTQHSYQIQQQRMVRQQIQHQVNGYPSQRQNQFQQPLASYPPPQQQQNQQQYPAHCQQTSQILHQDLRHQQDQTIQHPHQSQQVSYAPQQSHQVMQQPQQQQYAPTSHQPEQQQQGGYRFGDLTRSVISKGKKKDGRTSQDGYKFGDFTRGMFG